MLEREEGLSAEEKMEAQLLYDREKNGHHVGDNLLNDESVTGLEDILRSVPRRPAIPGYLPTAGYPRYHSACFNEVDQCSRLQ